MGKKKDENKVVMMMPMAPEERQGPTKEEIEEQMRRDEEELERHLRKYAAVNPQSESSGVEEQDEEEETVTLDFTEEGVTAYEKVGEGVLMRDDKGNVTPVYDEEMIEQIKRVAVEPTEPTPFDKEKNRFQDMITERLVSKAIAALLERLSAAQLGAEKAVKESGLQYLSDRTGDAVWTTIDKQKKELKQAWNNGVLRYDNIPSWAMPWVEDYIKNGLNSLLDFVERD